MALKTFQILLVDDDPNLRATMGDILKHKGFVALQADTGSSALEIVAAHVVDVALIDLHLEDMPGMELIHLLKEQNPGIECILLTGHASQSSAIDAINAGAYSYFQKPCDIDQLVLSIQRAAEKKVAQMALRESEASLQAVLQSSAEGILAVSRDSKVLYANTRFTELWRVPPEVMESHEDAILLQYILDQLVEPEEFLRKVQELYQSDEESFDSIHFKDGRIFERISRPLSQDAGIQGRVWSFHDITQRKQAEEQLKSAEQKYRSIFENAMEGIHQTTPDGKILSVNPAGAHILGYDLPEELLAKADLLDDHFYVQPGRREEFKRLMETHAAVTRFESEVYRKDGSTAWLSENAHSVCDEDGRVLYFEGTSVDITERKRTEEALRESEERFRSLYENATVGMYRTTPDGNILMANPVLVHLLGFDTFEQLANRNLMERGYEPDYPRSQFIARMEKDGQVNGLESAWHRQDGGTVYVRESARAIRDAQGQILYYDGTVEDVSERKQAEMQLLANQETARAFAEHLTRLSEVTTELSKADSLDALCRRAVELGRERLDFDRLAIWFIGEDHTTMLGSFGVDTEGRITDERQEQFIIGPDFPNWSVFKDQVPLLRRENVPLALKGKLVGQGMHISAGLWDGKTVIGYISLDNLLRQRPFSDSDTELIRLYASAVGHLISVKRAERDLRTSEERYRMLADNMTDTIWLMDLNLKTTYISPSVTKLRGYTLEELNDLPLDQQMTGASFARVVKLYKIDFGQERLSQVDLPISTTLELELYKKDGSTFWSENTFTLIRNAQGQPLAILGSGRDITESKQAQEALVLSEKRFRALTENNTDAIVLADPRGLILYESPAYARMMGRDTGQRVGRSSFEFIHPDDQKRMSKIFARAHPNPRGNKFHDTAQSALGRILALARNDCHQPAG